ncbi:MAG TPA: hypothetical protein VGB77_08240, partial [Abditibacteriaceae bacterium]
MSNAVCANPSCGSSASPPGAHFCVECGYALQQKCPWEDCSGVVTVRADKPEIACRTCGRFLLFCAHCWRLHVLGKRCCETRRCREAGRRVSEFFAPCHAREGENGSGAARLPAPWVKEGKKLAQGDWWPADLPEIAALNGLLGWAGVAFRYRQLVALRHDKLLTL